MGYSAKNPRLKKGEAPATCHQGLPHPPQTCRLLAVPVGRGTWAPVTPDPRRKEAARVRGGGGRARCYRPRPESQLQTHCPPGRLPPPASLTCRWVGRGLLGSPRAPREARRGTPTHGPKPGWVRGCGPQGAPRLCVGSYRPQHTPGLFPKASGFLEHANPTPGLGLWGPPAPRGPDSGSVHRSDSCADAKPARPASCRAGDPGRGAGPSGAGGPSPTRSPRCVLGRPSAVPPGQPGR